jgi:hypothetical protein
MIHQLGAFELPEESMDVRIVLTGKSPLVMHSARLADPLYEITRAIKQITDKRTKTEADYESIARMEWIGGLYTGESEHKDKIVVPTWNVVRSLEEAAKVTRMGKTVIRSLSPYESEVPLDFPDSERHPHELWELDEQYRYSTLVGIQRNKTTRMRPQFPIWGLTMTALLQEELLDFDELGRIATQAGKIEGLGDARKLGKGRFDAKVEKL